jgi:hypothetical protein
MASPRNDTYSAPRGRKVRVGRFGATPTGIPSGSAFGSLSAVSASAPVVPGNIVQYLTSDGGSSVDGSTNNFSGPTRDRWHKRLGVAWKRTNLLGNWLDAGQVAEGTTPYSSTGTATAVGQTLSATVTTLVQRWMTNGQNRGFYLMSRGTAWPLDCYGRLDPTSANRPKLTVVATGSGTTVLTAAANATWNNSSFAGFPSGASWRVAAGSQPAILRFDLSTISGTVTSATLSFVVQAFPGASGQIVDVFEADPPELIVPESSGYTPITGLAAEYPTWNALKTSGDPALIFADDFELGGWADTGFVPAATRTLNPATSTTYARGTIQGGGAPGSGTGSANVRSDVSVGVDPRGTPSVVVPELFGQYWWYMEADFGTQQDDAIKIPAMGVQFGQWNPVGYWQQTTGNGGYPGTGLKVDNGGGSNFEYQGHSVRLLTGTRPLSEHQDPYDGWFALAIYPYNLDQGGPFPAGEAFPNVVIRPERWYCFDIRVKQNSMSGAQDALGNYAAANADGVYQVWINGLLCYSKINYRWRRHADFGVQGMWIDVYHGGVSPALVDMHYRVDRVSLATEYIGPPATVSVPTLPSWIPDPGEIAQLTVANGGLTNNIRDVVAANFQPFYSAKIVNDYSGGCVNPYFGSFGATICEGGGHSSTNDNSVFMLVFGADSATWRRVTNPTPFAPGNDIAVLPIEDVWGEYTLDGQPASRHSYGDHAVVGPDEGGAAYGTFYRLVGAATGYPGENHGEAPHKVEFTALTGTMAWARAGTKGDGFGPTAPMHSAYVPEQGRIYIEYNSQVAVNWFDLATGTYVNGTGTSRTITGEHRSGGAFFYVPERSLLLHCDLFGGALSIRHMDVSVGQPSWVNTRRTLSASIPLPLAGGGELSWSQACWCPDNHRIIVGNVLGDPDCVYEIAIPTDLNTAWPCERVPFLPGQTITWSQETGYKVWSYNSKTKTINYFAYADKEGDQADIVQVYRPRGLQGDIRPLPVYQNSAKFDNASSFDAALAGTFNVGTGPSTGVVARVMSHSGTGGANILSFVIGGVTLTALAQQTRAGFSLNERVFYGVGLSLTGSQSWTATLDGATKIVVQLFAAHSVVAFDAGEDVFQSANTALARAVTPDSNSVHVGLLTAYSDGGTVTAKSGTTKRLVAADNFSQSVIFTEDYPNDPTMDGLISGAAFTPNWLGRIVRLQGNVVALPSWVPAPGANGTVSTLTVANGGLANNFRSQAAPYYGEWYHCKTASTYGGAFKNSYWGNYGCALFFSGGHANTNDNTVTIAEYGATAVEFKRVVDPTPYFGTSPAQAYDNATANVNHLMDIIGYDGSNPIFNYGINTVDGKLGASHTYGLGDFIGPEFGGAANGTYLRIATPAINAANMSGAVSAMALDFDATDTPSSVLNWYKYSLERHDSNTLGSAPGMSQYVGPQNRVYLVTNSLTAVRWFDCALGTYVTGSGTGFNYDGADGFDSGTLFYVPSRGLLICAYPQGGNITIQWMDVMVDQPTLGGTATLSTTLSVSLNPYGWGAATWCNHNNRILLGNVSGDFGAIYEVEIPAVLTGNPTWPVTRVQYTGPTLPNMATNGEFKRFHYDERIKSIFYFQGALRSDQGNDTAYVYRPKGT